MRGGWGKKGNERERGRIKEQLAEEGWNEKGKWMVRKREERKRRREMNARIK